MKRGKYFSMDLGPAKAINKKTKEEITGVLDLYNYTADANNVYYDRPHLDYPENYILEDNGHRIELKDYLLSRDFGTHYYAVISRNTKIICFERYKFDPCSAFYAVEISEPVYNVLSKLDYENLKLDLDWFGMSLFNSAGTQVLSGAEILFYIDSNNADENKILNETRLAVLKEMLLTISNKLVSAGSLFILNNKLERIRFTESDSEYLAIANRYKESRLYNCGRVLDIGVKAIEDIGNEMKTNLETVQKYVDSYVEGATKLFESNPSLAEIKSNGNILLYGYRFKEAE